ncbi:MAG: putative lipid II flippase FtsW [Dehalococcoidia bacterium]|nr:putative lipid II flippase FtsW [Dehalococcoidia bacterium]
MTRAAVSQPRPSKAAHSGPRNPAHAPDYLLLTSVIVLCVVGLIAVYSASYALGTAQFKDANYFIKRQTVSLALGAIALATMTILDYRVLMRLSPLIMLVALIGLAAVFVPGLGHSANGATRWIDVGPLPPLQPSEFAKLAVLVYLAAWLAAKGDLLHDLTLGVLPFVSMVGIVGALIILEPDLGTALVIAAITGTLFFVAGARLIHVLALAASGLLMFGVLVLSGGYRMDRITAFTSAEDDPSGVGFHALQLLVAFGSGGFGGLGLGVSRQKFFYVPGSHTDGILAIIGEELGYVGVFVVLALFLVLLYRGWVAVRDAEEQFGSLLAVGVLSWIAFQLLINVGGVTRLLPLTGIPLPLISFGGTSLILTMAAIGVLLSVTRYTRPAGAPAEAAPRPQRGGFPGFRRRVGPAIGGAR